jgi:hypothetical protein
LHWAVQKVSLRAGTKEGTKVAMRAAPMVPQKGLSMAGLMVEHSVAEKVHWRVGL